MTTKSLVGAGLVTGLFGLAYLVLFFMGPVWYGAAGPNWPQFIVQEPEPLIVKQVQAYERLELAKRQLNTYEEEDLELYLNWVEQQRKLQRRICAQIGPLVDYPEVSRFLSAYGCK